VWLVFIAIVLVWSAPRKPAADDVPVQLARGDPGVEAFAFAFSPVDRTIATAQVDGPIALRDATGGWSIRRFLHDRRRAGAVTFSPDGRFLALGGVEPDVLLCDVGTEGPARPLKIPVRDVKALAFSADGQTLAHV
jgi:WD40 repeat protein